LGLKERRTREKLARREEILAAARELLHQKGINAASMNQIAKQAELGVATLYSYFKNKEDLFITLQEEGLDLLKNHMLQALEGVTEPRQKLRQVALAFLDFSRRCKNYYYVINYFISTPEILFEPQLKDKVDSQAARALSVAEAIISEGSERKVFKQLDARRCSIMFWGLIHGLIQYKKLETTILKGDSHTEIFHYAVDHFIDSLCLPVSNQLKQAAGSP
jgi:AcrR family transcriptional regulator